MSYPDVSPQPDFPALEHEVLERWERQHTFEESILRREDQGAEEFVFYDGPPFANGLPHFGHLLTGYVKDAVPRYRTMRGDLVRRVFGWDCHGLPAEVEAEKELGISGHPEITRFGIANFNDACRTSVLRYTEEWRRYVTRQARWVDFDNGYKTLDLTYMESVMWAFKSLWDKGLVYEGFKVLAYCWRCETPLSNTETRMDDVYADRQDPALTVGFELLAGETADELLDGAQLLAWTTTPWTLPANLALAVGPDIRYAVVARDGRRYVLAENRLAHYAAELGSTAVAGDPDEAASAATVTDGDDRWRGFEVLGVVDGAALVGRRYRPIFDFFADAERFDTAAAFQVLGADFVLTEEGTGIVHMAPGFGEDDQIACNAVGIPIIVPMDEKGQYTAAVAPWAGTHVFDANPLVIRTLKDRGPDGSGAVLRHETYDHSYPHCWRCSKPLVYRAISSWFVAVSTFRDRMGELNEQIEWVPGHIKHGSFGKWLANARDWSISRNRFWGSPIPVWKSDNPEYPRLDVYGSLQQLADDFGVPVDDLHRPAIDELVRPNPDDPTGQSTMRRVPEVLDCWFESGSMPFAQVHYPFENADWFESHYPGDFIVEYHPQTRGWFYTLHVLATALFDRPAFRTCVGHGTVLGDDGQKASKSLRNYPDPMESFAVYGADAMRWYLLSSPILRGADFSVTEAGLRDTAKQVLLPLWNCYYFLALYANAAKVEGVRRDGSDERPFPEHVLDRYILGKTRQLVVETTAELDTYDLAGACATLRSFVDTLSNWYIRRSRQRFWDGDADAVDTLHTVLEVVSQLLAPLLPMVSEHIWRSLQGERATSAASVHLTDWPDAASLPAGSDLDDLVTTMDEVRAVCSATLSVRKAHQLRVRQPLAVLTVATADAARLERFRDVIADEVNVRDIVLTEDVAATAHEVLQVVPAVLGPRLGGTTQQVIKAVRSGDWTRDGDTVVAGGIALESGEYTLTLQAAPGTASASLDHGGGIVVLDTEVTDELAREGRARDLVRMIQQERKAQHLEVTDRIVLEVTADESWGEVVAAHRQLIADETLAVEVNFEESEDATPRVALHRSRDAQ